MSAATWRVAGRTLPGPKILALWMLATVPAPLVFFEWTHRWEEDPGVSAALWWIAGAVPVLAAAVAARWTWSAAPRRSTSAPVAAVVAAALVSAVFVAATMAVYRWVIPLTGVAPWRGVVIACVPLVICGAVVGHLLARGRPRRSHPSVRHGLVTGGITVVGGALLAQLTVQLGAEGSTVRYGEWEYGAVGPYASSAIESGHLTLPAAGRYAIYAVGFAPADPDCEVTGAGATARRAQPLTIPPGGYGGDAVSYAWVATVDVLSAGAYSLSCRTADPETSYTVGEVPEIRGAVAALIHWPLIAIWLLGAAPGLAIIAASVRRRAGRRPARDVTVEV
ncbi:hypothetical protein [Micromonospora sp. NPDC005203]|uniref:hypothetical protein n=1 Tax=Micromonospora sp. NPDC005203 TaxID=3364226 RepID=UPI00367E8C30